MLLETLAIFLAKIRDDSLILIGIVPPNRFYMAADDCPLSRFAVLKLFNFSHFIVLERIFGSE
ncbi:hypothetical protein PL18_09450 [Vibrio renipiscarius]|uniref:Uncharacterized protein n=1 Tax=Vibrio renipiscarius TaxID=1461322 RepID=A0A0C2JDC7_9VIBR|nr:hypothetical protein OJ16_13990 [Vibrio renipiscarius]KII79048.1 hypothetical protein PL18_09450 [Vibrio renipiscarius]